MGFSWWLLAGVVVGLLGGGWVFFPWCCGGFFWCRGWVFFINADGFVGLMGLIGAVAVDGLMDR